MEQLKKIIIENEGDRDDIYADVVRFMESESKDDARFLNSPINHASLILLGYTYHICGYYCAPPPADGGTYRLEYKATRFNAGKPVEGTEEWRAYLTYNDKPTIRRFKTLGELRDFHKGICGGVLF
jgi:hypothetical protein